MHFNSRLGARALESRPLGADAPVERARIYGVSRNISRSLNRASFAAHAINVFYRNYIVFVLMRERRDILKYICDKYNIYELKVIRHRDLISETCNLFF